MNYKAVLEAREAANGQPTRATFFNELEQMEAWYLTKGLHLDTLEAAMMYYGVNRFVWNMKQIAAFMGANEETVSLWLSITYYYMDKRMGELNNLWEERVRP